jgi:hypothetical protein
LQLLQALEGPAGRATSSSRNKKKPQGSSLCRLLQQQQHLALKHLQHTDRDHLDTQQQPQPSWQQQDLQAIGQQQQQLEDQPVPVHWRRQQQQQQQQQQQSAVGPLPLVAAPSRPTKGAAAQMLLLLQEQRLMQATSSRRQQQQQQHQRQHQQLWQERSESPGQLPPVVMINISQLLLAKVVRQPWQMKASKALEVAQQTVLGTGGGPQCLQVGAHAVTLVVHILVCLLADSKERS